MHGGSELVKTLYHGQSWSDPFYQILEHKQTFFSGFYELSMEVLGEKHPYSKFLARLKFLYSSVSLEPQEVIEEAMTVINIFTDRELYAGAEILHTYIREHKNLSVLLPSMLAKQAAAQTSS